MKFLENPLNSGFSSRPEGGGENREKTAKNGGGAAGRRGTMEGAVMKLENYETRLYCLLADELGNGARRVDYEDVARRLGCSRSTVTYNVGKLMSSGVIGCINGKLYLKE